MRQLSRANAMECIPSREEIEYALKRCDSSKKCWHFIGDDFVDLVKSFFEIGRLPHGVNMTWVTLIPKIQDVKEIKDFRPISMVGCIYKVIANLLSERLKPVMHLLVGDTQSAFVGGRQILDGALIAAESVN